MKRVAVFVVFVGVLLIAIKSAHAEPQYAIDLKEMREMSGSIAIIETRFGNIEIRFLPDVAPNHTRNFIKLANAGFYDGTTFHRVVPGFMIQGGCPYSKKEDRSLHGTGGPGYTIPAEFNKTPHKRGIVSMARSENPDSAGSQFFICVANADALNGKYTAFGEVISGMDVADKIVSAPRDKSDNPLERIEMKIRIVTRLASKSTIDIRQ